jgi:hypothetical protein
MMIPGQNRGLARAVATVDFEGDTSINATKNAVNNWALSLKDDRSKINEPLAAARIKVDYALRCES